MKNDSIYRLKQLFATPTPLEIAKRELEEAKRKHLNATSAMEYAKRMSEYHSDRIRRLSAYVEFNGATDAA